MFDIKNVRRINESQFISRVKSIPEKSKMGSFIDLSTMFDYEMFAFAENNQSVNDVDAVRYGLLVAESSADKLFSSNMGVAHAIQALRQRSHGSQNIAGIWIASDGLYHQILEERHTTNKGKGDKLRGILSLAHEAGASDMHLFLTDDHARVKFRIQGKLWTYFDTYPRSDMNEIVRELFYAPSSTGFTATQFDFSKTLDFHGSVLNLNADHTINVRYHHSPCDKGYVDVTMRLAAVSNTTQIREHHELESFGYLSHQARVINIASLALDGLLAMSGVTGSGKTTTIINQLIYKYRARNSQIKISSIEDPVESQLPFLISKDINSTRPPKAAEEGRKATDEEKLAEAIKDLGREDCDGVLLGEIRTKEAAIASVNLVDTGQHIMTTIHARNCIGVLEKLLNLDCPRDIIFKPNFFAAIVYQELVQKLCDDCKLTIEEAQNYKHYALMLKVPKGSNQVYIVRNDTDAAPVQALDGRERGLLFSEDNGFITDTGELPMLRGRLAAANGQLIDTKGNLEGATASNVSQLNLNPQGVIVGPDNRPISLFPVNQNGSTCAYNEEGRPILKDDLLSIIDKKLERYKNQLRLRDPRTHHVESSIEFEPEGCPSCKAGRRTLIQPNSNKINVGYRGLGKRGQTVAAEVLKPTNKLLNTLNNNLNDGIEYYQTLFRLDGRHHCDGLTSTEHTFHKVLQGEVCIDFFHQKYDLETFLEQCSTIEDQINMQLNRLHISINEGRGFQMLEYLNDIDILLKWQSEYRNCLSKVQ